MKKKKNINSTEENSLLHDVLRFFSKNSFNSFNYKQVSGSLKLKDKAARTILSDIIYQLANDKVLFETKRGKYQINPKYIVGGGTQEYITGIVDMKATGKAYITTEDGGEDIFINSGNTGKALHGDKVKVELFPKRKGRKTEGKIMEVVSRAKENFVGIMQVSDMYAFLVPDNNNMPVDIYIPANKINGAKSGEKALVKLVDWPEHSKNPFGEVTKVLGKPGNNNVEMQSILAEFDFPLSFPDNVEKEAAKIITAISDKEIKNRRDFRNIFTITIDPEDAKDFDDAVSLLKLSNGNWEVGVHIADVSHYVKPHSLVDNEGYERGTSIYMVDRVVPMLPEVLSNNVCSLKPHEDKLTFSAVFEMTSEAKLVNHWFGKTIINSNNRYNYDEVQLIIETEDGLFKDEILVLNGLARKLREERFKKGSIGFETEEVKFKLDENGKALSTYIKQNKESNQLIEEFMLLANKKVAEFIGKNKINGQPKTFVYRIHDAPSQEKLSNFVEFVGKLGYTVKTTSHAALVKSFNNLFESVKGKGEENLITTIAVRTMAKAYYSTDNIGHYGLAFPYYSHFTSPIRRYPDLMVHRLLEHYLAGGGSANKEEYEEKCKHSSDMEKRAADAERASIKYKQAEYMLDKIGQIFEGHISGVSKWGIYVEIIENKCEGMVVMRDMDDDNYYLDEDNYVAIGYNTGKRYRLGDKVKIKVKRIDLAKKQMDFVFV
jgi:ribonuclease R